MNTTRIFCFWAICGLGCMAAFSAHAVTVSYNLDNVVGLMLVTSAVSAAQCLQPAILTGFGNR